MEVLRQSTVNNKLQKQEDNDAKASISEKT